LGHVVVIPPPVGITVVEAGVEVVTVVTGDVNEERATGAVIIIYVLHVWQRRCGELRGWPRYWRGGLSRRARCDAPIAKVEPAAAHRACVMSDEPLGDALQMEGVAARQPMPVVTVLLHAYGTISRRVLLLQQGANGGCGVAVPGPLVLVRLKVRQQGCLHVDVSSRRQNLSQSSSSF